MAKMLFFDVPVAASPATLRGEGIARVVETSVAHPRVIVTVMDAADHRLLRAGVVVAHRVFDGQGQWYLSAPSWQPWLPEAHTQDLGGDTEMPSELARRIQPLVRCDTVAPVATMQSHRRDFALRDQQGELVAVVRDYTISVRRPDRPSHVFREVHVSCGEAFTHKHHAHIRRALENIGGVETSERTTLQQRIGPPATGGSDFPAETALAKKATLEEFVTWLLSSTLRQLTQNLLAMQAAETPQPQPVIDQMVYLRNVVMGLSAVMDPSWCRTVLDLTQDVAGTDASVLVSRALRLIDVLVVAVRAPRLGDSAHLPAKEVMFSRTERAAVILADRCRDLAWDSPQSQWDAAVQACASILAATEISTCLFGGSARKAQRELDAMYHALIRCSTPPVPPDVAGLSAEQAFEAGCQFERAHFDMHRARHEFVEAWPKQFDVLRRKLAKVRKKL